MQGEAGETECLSHVEQGATVDSNYGNQNFLPGHVVSPVRSMAAPVPASLP